MKYSYFVTSELKRELDRPNLNMVVSREIGRLLDSHQPMQGKERRKHSKVYLQRPMTDGGPRLVFFKEVRDDIQQTIYVLRKAYENHDEYEQGFINGDVKDWIERHQYSDEERSELDSEFERLSRKKGKDPLPEDYRVYEVKRNFELEKDSLIFELPDWANGMEVVSAEYWITICDGIAGIVDNPYAVGEQDPSGVFFSLYLPKIDHTITYRVEANGLHIYLLQIVQGRIPGIKELVDKEYNCGKVSDLRDYATKCYPSFFTIDYTAWKAIETDNDANLALSEEEIRKLQGIQYPFFISGLAGSGKSTILYYLFANAYRYVVKKDLTDHELLFLSYSNNLVDNARSIVESILRHSTSRSLNDEDQAKMVAYLDDQVKHSRFIESFQHFRDFILNTFLDEGEMRLFPKDKYIDYKEFMSRYEECQLREKCRFSADIVWSVIRTYIKGRGLEDFTDQDYMNGALVSKDRTVTNEDFRDIYKIYRNWYRHIFEEQLGWDDLDLVRFALRKKVSDQLLHRYAVVFCDEAQDFTKLEIDLILRLSVHSRYDLSRDAESSRIPVAFAGDPNQTINPTGFRWGSTQDLFTNSFREALGKFQGFKPNVLRRNYRSLEGIVKFANTLQSIRHQHFHDGNEGRNLQLVRSGGEEVMKTADRHSYVSFFSLDEYGKTISDNLQNAIIITADEGEHPRMDAFLETAQGRLEKGHTLKLHTALSSKGLEFKAIMLYRFGCDKAAALFGRIAGGERLEDPSELYELAHFFTKLYIAVSRAKRVLYIVDTDEGYNNFWKYFVEEDLWKQVISKLNLTDRDRNLVGYVGRDKIERLVERLKENYNSREYANALFLKARSEENSETMRAALSAYREAQMGRRAEECEAYIELFEHRYERAGELFYGMEDYERALDAYWNGKHWTKVIEAADMVSGQSSAVRRHVARFMSGMTGVSEFITKWKESETLFQDHVRSSRDRDLWLDVFHHVDSECTRLKPADISASLAQNLDELADYADWYDGGLLSTRAILHYRRAVFVNRNFKGDHFSEDFQREDYRVAASLWEDRNEVQTKEYYIARKFSSSTPSEEIVWMDKLGESKEILSRYGDSGMCGQIGATGQGIVFSALLNSDYERAIAYPYPTDLRYRWARLYEKDPLRFLTHVVLDDFTLEKFFFLAEKVHDGAGNLFAAALPSLVYDRIFRLQGSDYEGKPYWAYFQTELKDGEGYCPLRNAEQITPQLDALSSILAENPDRNLASCFLDILFSKQYNYPRTEKYVQTLARIIDSGSFIREDFRLIMRRNEYFTVYGKLSTDALDGLKDCARKFVQDYMKNVKKKTAGGPVIKSLCHLYETCISYTGTDPDFKRIVEFYSHWVHEKVFAPMREWLQCKVCLYRLLDDGLRGMASFANLMSSLEEKGIGMNTFMGELNREEACALVVAVNMSNIPCVPEAGFHTARLMYMHDLRADDFKMFCKVDTLRPNIDNAVKDSIEWYLGRTPVSDYAIKILAFAWENLYGHSDVATRYEELQAHARLAKKTYLVEYLKKRALLHYSYLKQTLFEEKQQELGIRMSKDYLPSRHPEITEKGAARKAGDKVSSGIEAESSIQDANSRDEEFSISFAPSSEIVDPLKLQAVTIARNLKAQGILTVRQICEATGLTEDEISRL